MPRKKNLEYESFKATMKELKRVSKEKQKLFKEGKRKLKLAIKQNPELRETLIPGFIVYPPKVRGPKKKRKEVVLSSAETQKRYRQKKKKLGYREIKVWVKEDEKLKPEYEYVAVKVHQSSIGIGTREPNIRLFLAMMLNIAADQANKNLHSGDFVEDLNEIFRVLGLEDWETALEEIDEIMNGAQETVYVNPATKTADKKH